MAEDRAPQAAASEPAGACPSLEDGELLYGRPCNDGGRCTPKGMAEPGFCKCKEDADRIAKLEQTVKGLQQVVHERTAMLAERCVCRCDEGGNIVSMCAEHQYLINAAAGSARDESKEQAR